MTPSIDLTFKQDYQTHLQHLQLKGLRPKTIEAYSRAIRRIGDYFEYQLHDLSEQQLLNYFTDLLGTHSWSAVKLDLYGPAAPAKLNQSSSYLRFQPSGEKWKYSGRTKSYGSCPVLITQPGFTLKNRTSNTFSHAI